jgi:hypothetical protein
MADAPVCQCRSIEKDFKTLQVNLQKQNQNFVEYLFFNNRADLFAFKTISAH